MGEVFTIGVAACMTTVDTTVLHMIASGKRTMIRVMITGGFWVAWMLSAKESVATFLIPFLLDALW